MVEVPIEERVRASLPLLFLGDDGAVEMSVLAASYARNKQLEGLSGGVISRHVKAIGRLYDFYTLKLGAPSLDETRVQLLIKQFWEARRHGCPELGWLPVSYHTARDDLNAVTQFSDFCHENFGHTALNPAETVLAQSLSASEQHRWLARKAQRNRYSLLAHLTPATKEGRGELRKRRFDPEAGGGGRSYAVQAAKFFPPDRVFDLIAETKSLRNRLCWMLMFFGGVRTSELAHLFVNDIQQERDGTARVVLAHPSDAPMEWVINGKSKSGTRAAFLLDKYGRVPRHRMDRGPEHAGWKGMLQDDARRKESVVNWSQPEIGVLFWKLHRAYMHATRLHTGDEHPYYFVATQGDRFGEVMKLATLRKQFYAAATRIGLSANTDGVNPHGSRHFFGWYCANVLKLSKENTQKLIHHVSMSSTEVYYVLDQAVSKAELQKAQERLQNNMPAFLRNATLLLANENEDE